MKPPSIDEPLSLLVFRNLSKGDECVQILMKSAVDNWKMLGHIPLVYKINEGSHVPQNVPPFDWNMRRKIDGLIQ